MAITAGTLSALYVGSNNAKLKATPATGGVGPYTYQWYKSTTPGFTPGMANEVSDAENLELNDTGLIPNNGYYYKVIALDGGASNAPVTYSQLAIVTTPQQLSQNQFAQGPLLGMVDLLVEPNTVSVQFDSTQATRVYAGQAVKCVDSAGGIPKVVSVAAASDEVMGFVNYDIKSQYFEAGSLAEISMKGNVMYLYATVAIPRLARVQATLVPGGVALAVGSSGAAVVGWAYDKAVAPGDLIRVFIETPSFLKA